MIIRKSIISDIKEMVDLSYIKRKNAEESQPQFWKIASGAEEIQAKWFEELLARNDHILLCSEENGKVQGFIIGRLLKAPEVYDPGGLTLMIDDFCVAGNKWDEIASGLISQVKILAKEKGARQILVVSGAWDNTKRDFLKNIRLTIASEWFVGGI